MKKIFTLFFLISFIVLSLLSYAQTSPDYVFGNDNGAGWNWTTGTQGTASLGGSYKWEFLANTSTNHYFKFGETASNGDGQGFWQNNAGPDMLYTGAGAMWTAYYAPNMGGFGAIYLSLTNGNYYVVKTRKQAGNDCDFAIFNNGTQAPVTITSLNRTFDANYLYIDVQLSDAKSGVEKVWVRYTTNNWVTSSIVEANSDLGGNLWRATIAKSNAIFNFYAFTTIQQVSAPSSNDADFFTVNYLNNSGNNYTLNLVNKLNYQLGVSTVLFSQITGANAFTWNTTTANDEEYSTPTNIGFTFSYCGTNYDQFQVSTNGFLRFGTGLISATATDALNGTLRQILAPLWDDLKVSATATDITYRMYGTAPNRFLVVEWKNVFWNKNAATANAEFQIVLYENGNKIEFCYGNMGTPNAGVASIGLVDVTPINVAGQATGTFLSINVGGSVGARVYHQTMGLPFNSIANAPSINTVFTFTPVAINPMSGTYTVGGTSPDFNTPSDAAMMLNIRGINAPVTLNIRPAVYDDIFHLINVSGTSETNTITVKNESGVVTFTPKNGNTATTAPSATSGDAMIRLDGTKYCTFDGLTLIEGAQTTTTLKFDAGFVLANSAVNSTTVTFSGARFNTIKNCFIDMNSTTGVIHTGSTAIRIGTLGFSGDSSVANSYNTVQDCIIEDFWRSGFKAYGFSGGNPDVGNRVIGVNTRTELRNTTIPSSGSDIRAIELDDQKDITIEKVDIHDFVATTFTTNHIYGIWMNPAGSGTDYCYGNIMINDVKIYNLSNGGTATTGFAVGIGITKTADQSVVTIKNCKIYNIYSAGNSTARATGLSLNIGPTVGSMTLNIFNNYIYDIKCPAGTGNPSPRGMDLQNTLGGTVNANVYYNTVVLNNDVAPTLAALQSACIYIANFGTSILDLRNNILVNTMTSASGRHACLYASANSNLLRLASTTDNNLYYTINAPTTNFISHDAVTGYATLTTHKNALLTGGLGGPRDVNAVTENPPFVSSTTPYDFHIQTGTPTQVEKGAKPIAGILKDYDGDNRDGLFPDIGADEGNFTQSDLTPPVIAYNLIANTTSTSNYPLNNFAAITDPSGINTTAGTLPRLYYKRSVDANTFNDNTNATDGWKYVEASNSSSPFSFTINYNLLFGAIGAGTQIQYFVVAQDLASTPNVGINSGTFNTAPSSVNLVAGNFPLTGTINSYYIGQELSGDIEIGTAGVYSSLTGANGLFDAINKGVVSGNINAIILENLTEDGTVALNQWSESGAGNYTLKIAPSEDIEKVISGNVANAMIRFNGADRVTIDGRFNGSGNYLTLRNTHASNPVILYSNDACNNTLRNCSIEGNVSGNPLIYIGVAKTGGTGNDYILISNNNIRSRTDVAGTYQYGIYAFGSGSNTSMFNDNISILNNAFYDFYTNGASCIALYIDDGNTDFTISGNSFYQTATRTPSTSTTGFHAILVSSRNGGNFQVTNNYIGGTAPLCGGTPMTITAGTGISSFMYWIRLYVGSNVASSVQGNVIRNINFTSNYSNSTTTASSPLIFDGIFVQEGTVNIGNISGNTIGSSTANGSIVVTASGSCTNTANLSPAFYGIDFRGVKGIINNNIIGGINLINNQTKTSTGLATLSGYGIVTSSNILYDMPVQNNIIGSTTVADSWLGTGTSTDGLLFEGILMANNSSYTVNNNTVANLTNNTTGANTSSFIRGIDLVSNGNPTVTNNSVFNLNTSVQNTNNTTPCVVGIQSRTTNTNQVYENNLIYGLRSTTTAAVNTIVEGIALTSNGAAKVSKNRIYDLTNTATGTAPSIYGMYVYYASSVYSNNMIILNNSTNTNSVIIRGIYDNAGTSNSYYYNSVLIGGSQASGTTKSQAFVRDNPTNVIIKNNILYNMRTGGTGNIHFAISNAYTTNTPYLWSESDYNNLYSSDPNAIGEWNTTAYDFANWKTISSKDANSKSITVNFTSLTNDLHLTGGSIGDMNLAGTPISGITTDFDGDTRNSTKPYMGFDEAAIPLGVELASFIANAKERDITLKWETKTETNSSLFVIERSIANHNEWKPVGSVKASGNSNSQKNYSFLDKKLNSGKFEYRLKMIDVDGTFEYSKVIEAEIEAPKTFALSQNYPNPFNPSTKIDYQLPFNAKVTIELYSVTGESVAKLIDADQTQGYYSINLNAGKLGLASGVYIYRMTADNKTIQSKFTDVKKMMLLK